MPYDNSDKKKAMIEALQQSLGIVTDAARVVGIHRDTHYHWMKDDEEYKRQVDGINDIAFDYVESKLYKRIEKEDTTAIIFYAKSKMKSRGYVERQEIDNTLKVDGKPTIKIEFEDS